MKVLLVVLDGLADERTPFSPMSQANSPILDRMCMEGCCGLLQTIPDGMYPGSEVANLSILGYDVRHIGEGRAFFELVGKGAHIEDDEYVCRCNLVTLEHGLMKDSSPEGLTDEEQEKIISSLNLYVGNDSLRFAKGRDYRHFLLVKKMHEDILPKCHAPHDILGRNFIEYLPCGGKDTTILTSAILKSWEILRSHLINSHRLDLGKSAIDIIWPWSPSLPQLLSPISVVHPSIKRSVMISGVDVMKGIGKCAGMYVPDVDGATGGVDTDYEAKAAEALKALDTSDLVYLHIEAPDEAGHKGDGLLKRKCIENIDGRLLRPLFERLSSREDVLIAVLPDHPTPYKIRKHTAESVPFLVWHKGILPDKVMKYTELNAENGSYGECAADKFLSMLLFS